MGDGKRSLILEKEQVIQLTKQLENRGLQEGIDFAIERVFVVRSYIESILLSEPISESEYDEGLFDRGDVLDTGEVLHEEKEEIGFTLTNLDGEWFTDADINKLMELKTIAKPDRCFVCGARLVPSRIGGDRRMNGKKLVCIDCHEEQIDEDAIMETLNDTEGRCVICKKRVIIRKPDDKRRTKGGMRCFEHLNTPLSEAWK